MLTKILSIMMGCLFFSFGFAATCSNDVQQMIQEQPIQTTNQYEFLPGYGNAPNLKLNGGTCSAAFAGGAGPNCNWTLGNWGNTISCSGTIPQQEAQMIMSAEEGLPFS